MTAINPLQTGMGNYSLTNGKLTINMSAAGYMAATGSYQCSASNTVGTALSNKINLLLGCTLDSPRRTHLHCTQLNCYDCCKWFALFGDSILCVCGSVADVEQIDKTPKAPQYVNAYSWTVLNCKPPKYFPRVYFSWYFGATAQFVRPEYKPYLFVSQNGNLYFSYVTQVDAGEYTCMVTSPDNSVGQKASPQSLVVNNASARATL